MQSGSRLGGDTDNRMLMGPGDCVHRGLASSVCSEITETFFFFFFISHPLTTAIWSSCFVPGPKLTFEGFTVREPGSLYFPLAARRDKESP